MSSKIFRPNAKPLSFYIIPCKRKKELTKLITDYGGEMAQQRREAQYMLYVPGDIVSDPKMVSSSFIEDCIRKRRLLDIDTYRYTVRAAIEKEQAKKLLEDKPKNEEFEFTDDLESPPPSTSAMGRSLQYTVGEDLAIIAAVLKESRRHSVNGNRLWEILVSHKVTGRTALSMKERFVKKILPFADRYNISPVELKKLQSLTSAKTVKALKSAGVAQRTKHLPFLRAPLALPPGEEIFLSSSSDDEPSLGSDVLQPIRPLRKRTKPAAIMKDVSSTDPSSQSSADSQNPDTYNRMRTRISPRSAAIINNDSVSTRIPNRSRRSNDSQHTIESQQATDSPRRVGSQRSRRHPPAKEAPRTIESIRVTETLRSPERQPTTAGQCAEDTSRSAESQCPAENQNSTESQRSTGSKRPGGCERSTESRNSSTSYVIEDSSPEALISGINRTRSHQSSESIDLALCEVIRSTMLPKLSVKLMDVSKSHGLSQGKDLEETTSTFTSIRSEHPMQLTASPPSASRRSSRQSPKQSPRKSPRKVALIQPNLKSTTRRDNTPSRTSSRGQPDEATTTDVCADDIPSTQPFTISLPSEHPATWPLSKADTASNKFPRKISEEVLSEGGDGDHMHAQLSTHAHDISSSGRNLLPQPGAVACSSKSKDAQKSGAGGDSQMSHQSSVLLDMPIGQPISCEARVEPLSLTVQNSGSSVEFICEVFPQPEQRKDAPATQARITESDERFRLRLLSDSLVYEDEEVWPCQSPLDTSTDTPSRPAISTVVPEPQKKDECKTSSPTVTCPVSQDQGILCAAILPPPTDQSTQLLPGADRPATQLSWSTLDMNSQQSNRLSTESVTASRSSGHSHNKKSEHRKRSYETVNIGESGPDPGCADDASQVSKSTRQSPRLPKYLQTPTKLDTEFRQQSTPRKPDAIGGEEQRYSTPPDKVIVESVQRSKKNVKGSIKQDSKCGQQSMSRKIDAETAGARRCSAQSEEGIVDQSWSEDGDDIICFYEKREVLPMMPPAAPKRRNMLPKVLRQPMRGPQYEDANSTLATALSQDTAYQDCLSGEESDADNSFHSVATNPDQLVDEKNQGDESTSMVKTEPLVPKLPEAAAPLSSSPIRPITLESSPAHSPPAHSPPARPAHSPPARPAHSLPARPAHSSPAHSPPARPAHSSPAQSPPARPAHSSTTAKQESPIASVRVTTSPIASTSRQANLMSGTTKKTAHLYINKCSDCSAPTADEDAKETCHINLIKLHAAYSRLMFTYRIEDSMLLALVCGFSMDWELLEQHIKSDGKIGRLWTQNDDRLLTNPSFRKKNLKELRKRFSSRELKTRKEFLLEHLQLTPMQRKTLLGMISSS